MDLEPSLATLKALLKRVPLLLKTAILNVLSLSPTGGKQNLRIELTVSMIRSFIDFSSPPGKAQKRSMKDPGVKGRMWISKVKAPRPAENDVLDALLKVVDNLKEGEETYDIPELLDVVAEWTGFRSGVDSKAKQPDITEEEKYKRLMEEVKEDLTVLYFHGGAYHMMDPCTHRVVTSKIARMTGGRCYSVRYRLAPQAPFPAAVLDALVSYLTLVSPPEGSFHSPVPANKIVFAGDSAGGGLSLALLQTLLTLRRLSPNPTIRFHGKDVPIDLPAGLCLTSPWCDVTRSLPSTFANEPYDYLAPPHQDTSQPYVPYPFPEDATWPISPPRVDFYANANALIHPLVSPLAGPNELWKDTPPIYISVGQESLEDDGVYFARKIHRAGGTAVLERFEGKPHCFALIFLKDRASKRSFQTMTEFCLDAVKGGVKKTEDATFVNHDGKKTEKRSFETMGDLSDEEVQKRLKAGRDWRVAGENDLVKKWKESIERAKL